MSTNSVSLESCNQNVFFVPVFFLNFVQRKVKWAENVLIFLKSKITLVTVKKSNNIFYSFGIQNFTTDCPIVFETPGPGFWKLSRLPLWLAADGLRLGTVITGFYHNYNTCSLCSLVPIFPYNCSFRLLQKQMCFETICLVKRLMLN